MQTANSTATRPDRHEGSISCIALPPTALLLLLAPPAEAPPAVASVTLRASHQAHRELRRQAFGWN
jgi:hypothetical protein